VHPQHHRDVGRRNARRHEERGMRSANDTVLGLVWAQRRFEVDPLSVGQRERHRAGARMRPVSPWRRIDGTPTRLVGARSGLVRGHPAENVADPRTRGMPVRRSG